MKRKKKQLIVIYVYQTSATNKNTRIIHCCKTSFPFKGIQHNYANFRPACLFWGEMSDCSVTTKYVNFNTYKDKNNAFNIYLKSVFRGMQVISYIAKTPIHLSLW